jgi:hypothetical protein
LIAEPPQLGIGAGRNLVEACAFRKAGSIGGFFGRQSSHAPESANQLPTAFLPPRTALEINS